MKLQEIMKQYRTEHRMSLRAFAKACGLSNGYLSLLEGGINPKTGEQLSPTVETLEKIARGMGISLDSLFGMMGDNEPFVINADPDYELRELLKSDPELRMLLSASAKLNKEDVKRLIDIANIINKDYE